MATMSSNPCTKVVSITLMPMSLRHYVLGFTICPSVLPIFVNTISQERLEGISSNLIQMFTWTNG